MLSSLQVTRQGSTPPLTYFVTHSLCFIAYSIYDVMSQLSYLKGGGAWDSKNPDPYYSHFFWLRCIFATHEEHVHVHFYTFKYYRILIIKFWNKFLIRWSVEIVSLTLVITKTVLNKKVALNTKHSIKVLNKSCLFIFLWVCHLTLGQREDDPVVGWLNHFIVLTLYQNQHKTTLNHPGYYR